MIEVVTDDKWRVPIGKYLKEKCFISADIGDSFSYIGFIEDEKNTRWVSFYRLGWT